MTIRTYHVLAATLVAFALPLRAGYVDITINDGSPDSAHFGTDTRVGSNNIAVNEWGETEAGTINNNSWDLRAFSIDINARKLSFVSGFDPRLPLDNAGVAIGDIFIDTTGGFSPHTFSGSNPDNYFNSAAGFEYAINLTNPSHGNLAFDVVSLSGDSVLRAAEYAVTQLSSPASLQNLGSGSILWSGNFSVATKTDAELLNDFGITYGTNGGTNWVTTFDLPASLFTAIAPSGATFRLTEDCGNDLLVGYLAPGVAVAPVPETSTWVMGFLALGAVGFMVRRNAKLSV
ncbi:MAG: hypothetical protein WCO94_06580 [Verrucomicrobiota bacterium]